LGLGDLQLIRKGGVWYPGEITKARIAADDTVNQVYFDVFVAPFSGPAKPIRVTSKGPYRRALLPTPTLITTTPIAYKELAF